MTENRTTQPIKKLERERAKLLEELAHLRREATMEVDGDVGEGDPKWAERDIAQSLVDIHERKLVEVEQALEEARKGLYGICERCGRPIDPERLEILPETTLCIDCKQALEHQRPN